jgi:hypothetical protein
MYIYYRMLTCNYIQRIAYLSNKHKKGKKDEGRKKNRHIVRDRQAQKAYRDRQSVNLECISHSKNLHDKVIASSKHSNSSIIKIITK